MRKAKLPILLLLLLTVSVPGFTQRKSSRFDPDGSFWIEGNPPNEFSDFSAINLNAKRVRWIPSPGLQLNNGTNYRFKTLTVKRENFTFTTVTRNKVSYSFAGKFLRGGVFAASIFVDEIPVLEGTLSKFRDGKKVAEAKLRFVYFGGT